MGQKRNFNQKVVVTTGGASGIGLAVSRRFARAGARIGLLDMDEAALAKCRRQFVDAGVDVHTAACDVTSERACREAIGEMIGHFGGIDVLFNNAGITQRGAFVDTCTDVFRKVMAVNFFGSLYCTKAAVDSIIRRQGMIIANESIAGVAPLIGRTGYSASKHAMHGLFTSLRTELFKDGVHVLIVCPGFIRTNLQTRALGPDGRVTDHPQSVIGTPQTAESAAEGIFRAAEKELPLLVLTPVGKIGYWASRLFPNLYARQMARKLRHELSY